MVLYRVDSELLSVIWMMILVFLFAFILLKMFSFLWRLGICIYKEHAWETWRVSSLGKVKEVSDSDREGQNSKCALI